MRICDRILFACAPAYEYGFSYGIKMRCPKGLRPIRAGYLLISIKINLDAENEGSKSCTVNQMCCGNLVASEGMLRKIYDLREENALAPFSNLVWHFTSDQLLRPW